ncbi:odorant receptor 43a-like [Schistocerca americana]|uniref:odorant receptor 43a-like n=1 Tax=Schistocerca americana TaxID=7009 RepID=UPI001F4FFC55|nr:odorant receptor 43a-like [Schistocerca americana]
MREFTNNMEGSLSARHQESVLKWNVRVLTSGGLWPAGPPRLFAVFTTFVFVVKWTHILMAVRTLYLSWGDLNEITLTLLSMITMLGGAIKMTLFLKNRSVYYQLVQRLDDMVRYHEQYYVGNETMVSTFQMARKKALRLTFITLGYLNVLGPLWFVMPLLEDTSEKHLPFIPMHGLNFTSIPLYELSYVTQCTATFFWHLVSVGLDMFYASLMIHVTAQLTILNVRFTNLHLKTDHLSCRSNLRPITAPFDNSVLTEAHSRIFTTYLEDVMNSTVLVQFLSSVLVACVTLFQATIGLEVCTSAFLSAWVEGSRHLRRGLLVVMARARRPLELTAGRMHPINRATFVSLINASYTYYAVLRRVNDR